MPGRSGGPRHPRHAPQRLLERLDQDRRIHSGLLSDTLGNPALLSEEGQRDVLDVHLRVAVTSSEGLRLTKRLLCLFGQLIEVHRRFSLAGKIAALPSGVADQLRFEPLNASQEVNDDGGAREVDPEVTVQAQHAPETCRGVRGEVARAGYIRLDEAEMNQAAQSHRTETRRLCELLEGQVVVPPATHGHDRNVKRWGPRVHVHPYAGCAAGADASCSAW